MRRTGDGSDNKFLYFASISCRGKPRQNTDHRKTSFSSGQKESDWQPAWSERTLYLTVLLQNCNDFRILNCREKLDFEVYTSMMRGGRRQEKCEGTGQCRRNLGRALYKIVQIWPTYPSALCTVSQHSWRELPSNTRGPQDHAELNVLWPIWPQKW